MIRAARVGTGVWVGAVTIGVFALDHFLGTHWATAFAMIAIACGALHELYRMMEESGHPCHRRWGVLILGVAMLVRAAAPDLALTGREAREVSIALLGLGFLGPFVGAVARAQREVTPDPEPIRRGAATALGLGYVGLLATFLLELRMLPGGGGLRLGLELAFLLVVCVKIGDTTAYFVGRTIGRTPLSPVSPKKTWEGSVASIAGSIATAIVVGSVWLDHDVRLMVGFGLVADLAGQGGDLVESYVKRVLGKKDSSPLFGEMGGFLDMGDALLLAAPPAYLWSALLIARGV